MAEKNTKFQTNLNILINRAIPESAKDIRFDPDSFRVFMLIEDGQNLLEIYKQSNLDKGPFIQAVKKLYAQGLIYKIPSERYISQEKINGIKSSLAVYVGPVAQLIMDDAFTSLGLTHNNLPEPKVELLIEKIVDQIPFDKALEFKKKVRYVVNPNS